ncbi:hypothetical protein K431DRAFT_349091 [Polychaeton citri CBS 116435]|uniref:Cep57 centrosome microtubule-binding domain-containing protein n=1 Tax=Polychaeton citri CBS 116435 TaxID=1314669 RepID=A0A9P4Q1H0_9PEZI|nr:hypothetical protein K431DRAFT_349091 [Polychaeton citri CBS 116435]
MAGATSRARMTSELNQLRVSSPNPDDFATAHSTNSFDAEHEAIHSTIQFDNGTSQSAFPTYPPAATALDHDISEGSIELGRGIKQPKDFENDVSSSFRFKMGDDSIYSLTTTPPLLPKDAQRRTSNKEANIGSVRDSMAKRTASGAKHRTLSEAIKKTVPEANLSHTSKDFIQHPIPPRTRNSRFSSRQASGHRNNVDVDYVNNATASWTAHTGQSFALPDMSNIMDLLGDKSKNTTPAAARVAKRSRFSSASYKPNMEYAEIESVPIPEDEKAIYTSLQILREKVAQLELEKSEALTRAEEQRDEIIRLSNEVEAERRLRKADSALGSDDGSNAEERWRLEKAKMQANIKSLQERLDRSDRKVSNADIAVKRMAKERDNVLAHFSLENEDLKAENDELREACGTLTLQNEDLQQENQQLHVENESLRLKLAVAAAKDTTESRHREIRDSGVRTRLETRERQGDGRGRFSSLDLTDGQKMDRTATATHTHQASKTASSKEKLDTITNGLDGVPAGFVELVVRLWANAQGESEASRDAPSASQPPARNSSRSCSQRRESTFTVGDSTPLNTEDDHSTQMSLTRHARDTLGKMFLPSPGKGAYQRHDETKDVTHLTDLDINLMDNVRKTIEDERKEAQHQKRYPSASLFHDHGNTVRSIGKDNTQPKLKSSMKDLTANLTGHTRRASLGAEKFDDLIKAAKTVRVQSPHVSDEPGHQEQTGDVGDLSVFSNTSRRRRRAAATQGDGETSAFIVPDITLHTSTPVPKLRHVQSSHDPKSCTQCPHDGTEIDIPVHVPVNERDVGDRTDATIRPVLAPADALGKVLKQLQDEVVHLKLLKAQQDLLYNQHDPALSRRRRESVFAKIQDLCKEIERKSQQIYDLNDVLCEKINQKPGGDDGRKSVPQMTEEEIEETLQSIGIDPAEVSGRIGRSAPSGLDGVGDYEGDETEDLPWEGLSDIESETEQR